MNASDVTYRSQIRIERQRGPLRLAWLPSEDEPVRFGAHGAVAQHYGMDPAAMEEPHATTLDYVIAATGG